MPVVTSCWFNSPAENLTSRRMARKKTNESQTMASTTSVVDRLHRIGKATFLALSLFVSGPGQSVLATEPMYHLVGVSGGLQDGFAARQWLDYRSGLEDESKALLVGNALVKGHKAFLDIKHKGWREYVEEPGRPLVNPIVVPSGCAEHANLYAIYAVDSRQVLKALLSEPRFLSMTPDTGLVDLDAEETGQFVRTLASHHAGLEGKTDLKTAAFLLVTGVWSPGSMIESPVLYTKEDGTQLVGVGGYAWGMLKEGQPRLATYFPPTAVLGEVTDFPRSVALWAGTTDDARLADDEDENAKYWDSFHQAIRRAERQQQQQQGRHETEDGETGEAKSHTATAGRASLTGAAVAARPRSECRSQARYGSGPDTVRMGKEYTAAELLQIVPGVFGDDPAVRSEL